MYDISDTYIADMSRIYCFTLTAITTDEKDKKDTTSNELTAGTTGVTETVEEQTVVEANSELLDIRLLESVGGRKCKK